MGMRPVFYSRITQHFARPGRYASRSDRHGWAGHHTGIDFGSMWPKPIAGQRVRSSTPGRVVISDYNTTMGHWVGVYYPRDDVTITYWHLARRMVKVGQWVRRGTILGIVGNTGNSTAAHLHVQANSGRGFDYHGHLPPGRWCRGVGWWKAFLRRDQ